MSIERRHDRPHQDRHDAAAYPLPGVPGKSTVTSRYLLRSRDGNGVADGAEAAVERAAGSAGAPLPGELRERFESSVGADLGDVRVHTGPESADAASSVGARAYAFGQDIHFAEGAYDPSTRDGQFLIAHEVAHTVQQRGAAPQRQDKLETSSPGDTAELEADQAAEAMVSGATTTIGTRTSGVHRDFDPSPEPRPDPFGLNTPSGPPTPGSSPPVGRPGTNAQGLNYDIPANDYRSQLSSAAPPMDAAMPPANIADPGAIPGWKVSLPAQNTQIGPFATTQPATDVVIAGDQHSQMAKDAWAAYKGELIPKVRAAWDEEAKAKMDSYTQEKKGDPELERIIAESKTKYNVSGMKPGGGTVSEQGQDQQIVPGQTASDVADRAQAGGKGLQDDAKKTAAQPENTTVAPPVKAAVDALNAQKETTRGLVKQFEGTKTQLEGAKGTLKAAEEQVKQVQEKAAEAAAAEKDPKLEYAKKVAADIHPKLGKLAADVVEYAAPLGKLKDAVSSGATAVKDKDPMAALDAVMALVDIAKWRQLKIQAQELALFPKDNPHLTQVNAAGTALVGIATTAEGIAMQVEASLKKEKLAYDKVAAETEKAGNWKGANPEDAKAAANALRAIPVVDRIVRVLKEIKGSLPQAPSGGTRANQGFTLATQGEGSRGAADLLRVGSWLSGVGQVLDGEISEWGTIRASLQAVAGAMGVE